MSGIIMAVATTRAGEAEVESAVEEVQHALARLRRALREYDPRLASDVGGVAFPVFGALELVSESIEAARSRAVAQED